MPSQETDVKLLDFLSMKAIALVLSKNAIIFLISVI